MAGPDALGCASPRSIGPARIHGWRAVINCGDQTRDAVLKVDLAGLGIAPKSLFQ